MSLEIYRNAVPRSDLSDFPSYNFEDKFLLHDIEDSRSKTSWQTEEVGIVQSCGSSLKSCLRSSILLVSSGFQSARRRCQIL